MSQTIEVPVITAPVSEVSNQAQSPVAVILPHQKWRVLDFSEIWAFRELFAFLCWRDVKVRYKQTVLGGAWAILQPLMTMVVFSIFFARLANVSTGGIPYPLFAFAGLLPWTYFANAIAAAGQSVVGNERLITKVYFPRLLIPLSSVGAGLVDFAVASGMLGVLVLYYGIYPSMSLLLFPVMVFGLAVAAAGIGSLLAALNVAYRDFRYVIPFLVQLWMFATPTVYMDSTSMVSGVWSWLMPLNPAYGLIANFRAVVLGGTLDPYSLVISLAVSAAMFAVGTLYFRRVERGFADII
ncbi:ABC transporter permease [Singulisphaera sp. Ch08]|uniref:Transport permease protein n=1 Tax=Singulisphaera sp. Ch08 TaxID=3120278 RepID=A0AAU7CD62_9BACT